MPLFAEIWSRNPPSTAADFERRTDSEALGNVGAKKKNQVRTVDGDAYVPSTLHKYGGALR